MKKSHKIVAALAAITLLPCATAGMLTACNNTPEEHTHSYTKWDFDDDEHWKVCPDDNAVDESSKAEHDFDSDGKCECGATETYVYGTVTGKVKLHKNNAYEKAEGVTADLGDDDVNITGSVGADGVYSFTITDVKVKHDYTLTVSKAGYTSYSTNIYLEEENEVAPIDITLEYQAYTVVVYDESLHDFSNINNAEPTIKVNGQGSQSLNIISTDKYDDVSVTIKTKSANGGVVQGIWLKFEDDKYAMLNIKTDQELIQYRPDMWKLSSVFGKKEDGSDKWIESAKGSLTQTDIDNFNGDGAVLNLVRKGGTLYAFVDGRFILETELPEGYEDDKIQVGFFAFDVKANAEWPISVSETLPALESEITVNVTLPEDETECTVAKTPAKDKYAFGEQVTLTFNAPAGYKLDALTINGADKYAAVEGNALTITADRSAIEVEATFVKEQPIDIEVTVKGKKLGTTAALAENTQVKLSGIETPFTVNAEGKITGNVIKGRYTVTADGYLSKEITLDENSTEIVLEYDTFKKLLGWGDFNFTEQNADTPKFGITNDCAVILTKDTYGSGVKSSIYLKGENMNTGNGALVFRFVGEGMNEKGETITVTLQGTKKVQVSEDKLWNNTTVATGCKWNNMIYFENCNDDNADRVADVHAAEYLESYGKGELKFSVLREESTFYVFLNDRFIGKHTIDDKYKTAQCEIGFMTANLGNTTDWKYWNVDIEENVTRSAATITDATTANGSITIPENIKVGDTVAITIVPDNGYKISSLKVNDVDVTGQIQGNTYSFTVSGATTVSAEFVEIQEGSLNAEITGKKLGVTNALTAGVEVTLSAAGLDDIKTFIIESEGKTMLQLASIPAGEWTVSAPGYFGAKITVVANEEYTTAIALEYDLFAVLEHDAADHDFSHQNDVEPYISMLNKKTFNVLSNDGYTGVAATLHVQFANSGNNMHTQGIILKFEDGKHVIVRYHNGDQANGNIQYVDNAWNSCKKEDTLFGANAGLNQWGEAPVHTLTSDETTAIKGDGLDLTAIINQGVLHVLFDGKFVSHYKLPAGYADKKVHVGYFAWEAVKDSKWYFAMSDELPDAGSITNNTATDANGTVDFDGTNIKIGDEVQMTITPQNGYVLESLTVNGKDVTAQVIVNKTTKVGTYTYIAESAQAGTVAATFKQIVNSSLESAVTFNRLDAKPVTAAVILSNANFEYECSILEGKIVLDTIAAGEYTASVNGCIGLKITVTAEKYTEALTFEYDTFKHITAWGSFDFTQQNANPSIIGATNDCHIIMTNDKYDDVMATIYLKGENVTQGNQGILFRFTGDGCNNNGDYIQVRMEGKIKIQFALGNDYWSGASNAEGSGWQDLIFFEDTNDGKADADAATYIAAYDAGTLKLTAVRKGSVVLVYLNDKYIGQHKFADKYANMQCEAGFIQDNTNGNTMKKWKVEITDRIPDIHNVSLTVNNNIDDKNRTRYNVSIDTMVESNGKATLTISTPESWYAAWSYFPSSVKVNGEEKFVATDMVSNGANRLTYTLVIENVTADISVVVEIAQGETIKGGVTVNVKDNIGGTAVSDSDADGYYWNDGCEIYMVPAEGYEIESITVDDGTPVTTGWTFDSENNRYVYTLPISITKQTTVVVAYKAVEQTPPVTE